MHQEEQSITKEVISFTLKAVISVVALLALLFIAKTFILPAPTNGSNLFVTGKASEKVKADTVTIVLGGVVEGTSPTSLIDEANRRITKVSDWAQKLGISSDKISVKDFALSTKFDSVQKPAGYKMDVSVEIIAENIASEDRKLGDIVEAGTNAGLTEVRRFDYSVGNLNEKAAELKKQAFEEARNSLSKEAEISGLALSQRNVEFKVSISEQSDKNTLNSEYFVVNVEANLYY